MDLLQGPFDIKLKWTRFETIAQTIEYVQEWGIPTEKVQSLIT